MPESPQVQVGEGSTSRNASTGNTYKVQGVGTLLARGWKSPVRSVLVPQPLCVPTTTAAETAGQQAAGGSFPADFLGIQAGLESPAGLLLCPDEGTFPVREVTKPEKPHILYPYHKCFCCSLAAERY